MFQGKCLRVSRLAGGIAELCFDRQGESINKLDTHCTAELAEAVRVLQAASDVSALVVRSAKDVFIVGADIMEFPALFRGPEAAIEAFLAQQNLTLSALEDLPMPIVVAINGHALGGGLEQALASDYRLMASTAQVGLPEVTLGLIPGFGGTARLPRLASAAVAIDWISTGKPRSAEAAHAAGVVDEVIAPEGLQAAANALAVRAAANGQWRGRRAQRRGPFSLDAAASAQARASLARSARLQPAALAAVDLLERSAPLERDAAVRAEAAQFARLAKSQAASSLVQLFISERMIRNKAKAYARQARKVERAGVLGAGIMGGGIAYSSAQRGIPIVMKDIAEPALAQGMAEAGKQLAKQVEGGRMKPERAAAILGSIRPTLTYEGFEGADVVIEAVVENLGVKQRVLADVEALMRADAVLASNTSSLSIATMAVSLSRPQNFVGMHFFNPVPVMPLVEVIRGPATSDVSAATIAGYAGTMGKTAVVVKDCPGFLVNRVYNAYALGFSRALADGADFLAIDRVMEEFGWPMGPAYLMDVIGMDTIKHVLEIISAGYPQRCELNFPLAAALLVERGRLGQKNGLGFYRYESDPKGKPKKLTDPKVAELLATIQLRGTRELPAEQIVERLMLPMLIEASICLEQGIAESAEEIDMALVLGLGFPRHAGGPLKYADWLGLRHVVARCEQYATLGALYTPTARMRQMAAQDGRYFA